MLNSTQHGYRHLRMTICLVHARRQLCFPTGIAVHCICFVSVLRQVPGNGWDGSGTEGLGFSLLPSGWFMRLAWA